MSRSTAQRCIGQRHLQTVEAELLVIALNIQLMVAPHGQHQMSPLLLGAQRHLRILLAVYCTSSVCMQSMQSAPAKHQPLLKERLSQQPCHLNRASSAGFYLALLLTCRGHVPQLPVVQPSRRTTHGCQLIVGQRGQALQ
jgi:hypothetical protein